MFLSRRCYYKSFRKEDELDGRSLMEFFEPSSVAVIGASGDPKKIGHMILKNILDAACMHVSLPSLQSRGGPKLIIA